MTDIPPRIEPKDAPAWLRALRALRGELVGFHPRLQAYNAASRLLPLRSSGELRARLLRLAGFSVGEGTRINGEIKISGPWGLLRRLSIGRNCVIESDCVLDLSEQLSIGDGATIGPGVLILTSTHELDFPKHRAGNLILNPVVVGDGVWLGARSVVLPGVKIGHGAVVEPGAVVNKDVEANTRVGGIPAAKLEVLAAGDAGS
jgi:maltose O-acetyltransferase